MVPGQAGSGSQTCCLLQGRSGSQGCSCTHQHTHGVGLCQNRSSPTHTTLLFFASRQIITTHQASAKSRAEMHSGGMHAASGIPVLVTAQEVESQTAGSVCCHVQLNCKCDVGVVDRSRRRGHLQIEGAVNHTLHSIKGLEGTAGFFSAHSNVDVRTLAGLPVCLSAHLFTHAHPAAPAEAHEFCHRRYVARPLVSTRAVRTALLTLTQHCTAKSVLIAIGFCAGPVKLVSGGHAGRVPLPNGLIQVRLKTTTVLSWSLAGLLSSWFSCTEASLSPGVVPTAWNS